MITKKLSNKLQQTEKPMKDKNWNPLTKNQKKERWVEHIELNRLTPETPPNIQAANTNLPIDGNKPSKTKIKGAITTLKNGKAAGFGEKTAEAIKADTETSVNKFAQPHL